MQRTDLSSSLTLVRRLRYAASALLSFAHWHGGFRTWLTLGDALHEAGKLRRALAAYDSAILLLALAAGMCPLTSVWRGRSSGIRSGARARAG